MDKTKEINSIYKILVLYEDLCQNDSTVTLEGYLTYIDRLYVEWLGKGNKEIYEILKGLWILGKDAGHKRVKSLVFHIISIIKKEQV